ncbi:MAG: hypothetical protein RI885_915 [Actinomycetota bacterium]
MTTIGVTIPRATRSSTLDRILAVVRLHFINPKGFIWLPLAIMAFIFLVNYLVWLIIFATVTAPAEQADVRQGLQYSGASLFIFVYMMVVAVQAINLTFPFAQGYGVTRRDFALGSAVAFVTLSALFSILWTALSLLEDATGGWGLGGSMFTAAYFSDGPWFERFFVYLAAFLFFVFIGAATAAAYVRWKAMGMYVFFAALTVAIVAAGAIITLTGSWPAVGEWLAASWPVGIALWSLVPTLASAALGYLILRRATPRS